MTELDLPNRDLVSLRASCQLRRRLSLKTRTTATFDIAASLLFSLTSIGFHVTLNLYFRRLDSHKPYVFANALFPLIVVPRPFPFCALQTFESHQVVSSLMKLVPKHAPFVQYPRDSVFDPGRLPPVLVDLPPHPFHGD
jgi:hypothetical protein